ncbi:MAG: signal peptidase I [bacterium]
MKHHQLLLILTVVLGGCSADTMTAVQKSSAMCPTIPTDSKVIIRKDAYRDNQPTRWDIVAYRTNSGSTDLFLSRVVGLPGETIQIADGKVKINGYDVQIPDSLSSGQSYVRNQHARWAMTTPYRILPMHVFLLSDNSRMAIDSRQLGSVHLDAIVGKVQWEIEQSRCRSK